MDTRASTPRLDAPDRGDSVLTNLTLPDGSAAGGVFVSEGDTLAFVLFGDEELERGDNVVAPSEQPFRVTSVRHAHVEEEPVTVLEVRRRAADASGGRARAPGVRQPQSRPVSP